MPAVQPAYGPDAATTACIATQNDIFRRSLGCAAIWNGQLLRGQVVSTPGFRGLSEAEQAGPIRGVIGLDSFTEDNDPWSLHDFGIVEFETARIFWQLDLYDPDYCFGVDLAAAVDPAKVRRVLTLYLPSEH